MRKRVFFFSFLAMLCVMNNVSAQKSKSIGVNAGVGFLEEFDFAKVGVEFNLDVSNHFRFSPSVNYFFSSSVSAVSLEGDLSYVIQSSDRFEFFPIVGVGYLTGDIEKFAFNVGMGMQYDLVNNFAINAKAKYQLVKDFNEIVLSIGVVKKF